MNKYDRIEHELNADPKHQALMAQDDEAVLRTLVTQQGGPIIPRNFFEIVAELGRCGKPFLNRR